MVGCWNWRAWREGGRDFLKVRWTVSLGTNVQQTLKLLEVLDTHSFLTSRSYNPLTTLYHRISVVQKSAEQPLADEMFAMLLCQWAVSAHRSGVHRPLVAARVLRQRQDQVIRVS